MSLQSVIKSKIMDGGIFKQLSARQGNPNELEDFTPALENFQVQPMLLTALFDGATNTDLLTTDVKKFDVVDHNVALPGGKAYHEKGEDLQKDSWEQRFYGVPSFGLRMNVTPEDVANKREPGTNELMSTDYIISQQTEKASMSWGLFDELGYADVLFEDRNIIRGGPFTQYNYYTDLIGSARPAATDMLLGTAGTNHEANFRKQYELMKQDIIESGQTMTGVMCICGDSFFNARSEIEQASGIARELRSTLDLASMRIPRNNFGAGSYEYTNFTGMFDGIMYINYGATIITGNKLVADADAYMIPMGVDGWLYKAYAPAKTMQYVNTEAQNMYMWTFTSEFEGTTTYWESNVLFGNRRPEFIRHLTTSTT